MNNIAGNKKGYLTFKGASRQERNTRSKVAKQLLEAYNNNKRRHRHEGSRDDSLHFSSIREIKEIEEDDELFRKLHYAYSVHITANKE